MKILLLKIEIIWFGIAKKWYSFKVKMCETKIKRWLPLKLKLKASTELIKMGKAFDMAKIWLRIKF
jgi:hypothetical protein